MSEINPALNQWDYEEIRAAFFRMFNESGEWWFGYFGTSKENEAETKSAWDEFIKLLVEEQDK